MGHLYNGFRPVRFQKPDRSCYTDCFSFTSLTATLRASKSA